MTNSPLLDQLSVFGLRARNRLVGNKDFSPWGPSAWGTSAVPTPSAWPQSSSGPSGVVVHYTAGPSLGSAVEWFCSPELRAVASAHYVIGRTRELWADALSADLPEVRALPVTVVECRPLTLPAYHATWANCIFAGLEVVNWGCAVPDPRFVTGVPGSAGPDFAQPGSVAAAGRRWQPYSDAQQQVLGGLIAALAQGYGIKPWGVVGHEHVQGTATQGATGADKRDPGPLLDLPGVRKAAFPGWQPPLDVAPGAEALRRLGYAAYGEGLVPSTQLFQRLMGLTPDGKVGPITAQALAARLRDRGLAASG